MKVYAIYDKENKFIVCFPDRDGAKNYGITTYGRESGWEYSIIEKWLYGSAFNTPNTLTPYSQPIPTTPYNHNIWRECNVPTATFGGETK